MNFFFENDQITKTSVATSGNSAGTVAGTVRALCGNCAGTVESDFAATSAPSGTDVGWKPGAVEPGSLAAGVPCTAVGDELD